MAARRKQAGLSQEALADKLGVSRQAVSKWERAESLPDTDNLIALATIYDLTLDELLWRETDESDENEGFDEGDDCAHVSFRDGIHVRDAKKGEDAHIGWSGVHVTNRKKGEEVHVGWDGVHVERPQASGTADDPRSVHVDSSGAIIDEQHFESWHEAHKTFGRKPERAWRTFPFPLVVLVAYLLLGLFASAWLPGLMLAFAVPAYYVIGNAWEKRRLSRLIGGLYPIGAVAWFCWMAFALGQAHPTWVVFLTIPLVEILCAWSRKTWKRRRKKIAGDQ